MTSKVIGGIGIILIVIGLLVLLSTGGVLTQLSFIRVGPVEAGGLPEKTTTTLFVGAVILFAGMGMAYKGFKN